MIYPILNSKVVPYVSLHPEYMEILNNDFVFPIVSEFFRKRNIPLTKTQQIDLIDSFSDIDFSIQSMDFIYPTLFRELKKIKTKQLYSMKTCYSVTFDKYLENHTIELYNKPIFYWVYIDVSEMMAFIRSKISNQS